MTPPFNPRDTAEPDEPAEAERDPVLERLLPRFVANRRRDVVTIIETLEQNEFGPIAEMGHNLKGTGRMYGHDSISEIGRALEDAARTHNGPEVRRQADALAEYLRCVGAPRQSE